MDCDDTVKFRLLVHFMRSSLGEYKYLNLSKIALHLLPTSSSNADCERVFSLLWHVRTDLRSGLQPDAMFTLTETSLIDKNLCTR